MNGILWASLGAAIGMLAPLLFRIWQRGADGSADTPPTAVAPRPVRPAVTARVQADTQAAAQSTGRHQANGKPPTGLNRKQARKFHGVSVKPGHQACQAVRELVDQRFLPEEAPALPLAACDQSKCQCAYAHHGDRRDREDRRTGWGTFGGFTPSIPGGNRRAKSRDRRSAR
jgi:hypothetical protein